MANKTLQENIVQELGLEGLPEKTQIELLTMMTESLLKRITVRILEQLPESEKEEFDRVREGEDMEKINTFLQEKVPNYDQMLQEILAEFKEEMKAHIELLQTNH